MGTNVRVVNGTICLRIRDKPRHMGISRGYPPRAAAVLYGPPYIWLIPPSCLKFFDDESRHVTVILQLAP